MTDTRVLRVSLIADIAHRIASQLPTDEPSWRGNICIDLSGVLTADDLANQDILNAAIVKATEHPLDRYNVWAAEGGSLHIDQDFFLRGTLEYIHSTK